MESMIYKSARGDGDRILVDVIQVNTLAKSMRVR